MRRTVIAAAVLLVGAAGGLTYYLDHPATRANAAQNTTPAPADAARTDGLEEAILAGGCFWCVEADFDKVPGVVSTTSGYTGGHKEFPRYREVSSKSTGHIESVSIVYDPKKVTYGQILDKYWHSIDPTDPQGQFCDKGEPYKTVIFVKDAEQERIARESKAAIERSGQLPKPVVTEIRPASRFWAAEEEHQDYYHKNPLAYSYYRLACGRDARVRELWGEPRS